MIMIRNIVIMTLIALPLCTYNLLYCYIVVMHTLKMFLFFCFCIFLLLFLCFAVNTLCVSLLCVKRMNERQPARAAITNEFNLKRTKIFQYKIQLLARASAICIELYCCETYVQLVLWHSTEYSEIQRSLFCFCVKLQVYWLVLAKREREQIIINKKKRTRKRKNK